MRKLISLLLLSFVVSTPCFAEANPGQTIAMALELGRSASAGPRERVLACETLLTSADEDRLRSYLGLEGPVGSVFVRKDGVQRLNVTRVGHEIQNGVAPLRPDVQVHFEVAAMIWAEDFRNRARVRKIVKDSPEANTYVTELIRLTKVSSAIVGAEALSDGEDEVWQMVRAKALQNAKDQNLSAIADFLHDHSANVESLSRTLRGLSEAPWVPEGVTRDIRLILEARLK